MVFKLTVENSAANNIFLIWQHHFNMTFNKHVSIFVQLLCIWLFTTLNLVEIDKMAKRKRIFECENNPDYFCYICGNYIVCKNKRKFTTALQEFYFQYFQMKVENLEENWTPNSICPTCYTPLTAWASGCKE